MARAVDAKVATGEHQSDSDVVREGLAAFLADDAILDAWLRDDMVAGCRDMAANPSRAIPADDVLSRIEGRVIDRS